jgi:hypothetical protein
MQAKQVSRQKMLSVIEDWKGSGLSQKQYCVQHNIRYHIFHYWYRCYRQLPSKSEGFVALSAPQLSSTGSIEMHLPDGKRIFFHEPVSSEYLKTLIG